MPSLEAALPAARLADRGDVLGVALRAAAEDRRAGDEHVRAGGDDRRRRLGADAAVDRDVDVAPGDQRLHLRDLLQHRRDEALPAEAGIDGHHQDDVEPVEHILDGATGVAGLIATPARLPSARIA